ncbi:MAG: hypothetical protein AAFN59_06195, partial [Pseudomonadota bacterium]
MYARFLVVFGMAGLALPTLADVTPSDVWALHQKQYSESGLEVQTRDVEVTGNRVTVRDLVMGNSTQVE